MSNYIKTDIIDGILRFIHKPNNQSFQAVLGLAVALAFFYALIW